MAGKDKLWTGDFVLILVVALLSCVACQALNNGTPIYLSYAGVGNSFAGVLILAFSLAAAVARIFMGGRIDTGSRRSAIIVGAALLVVGTAGAVVLPFVELQIVFRIIQGLGFGASLTAGSTAAADIIPKARLGEGLGYFALGQSLGMAIGPSLAIVLVSFAYHEALFAGTAVMSACLMLAGFACTYEKHPERLAETCAYRQDENEKLGRGKCLIENETFPPPQFLIRTFELAALPGALPMAISCLGYAIIVSFVSKYGVQTGLAAPGVFFVLAAVTMTAIRLFGGRLIDRVKPLALLAVPVLCGIVCFAILALTEGEVWFYAAGALFGLSMGLSFPLFNTVAVKCAPIERRGAASALYGLANDLGIGFGAVLWGAVIDVVGYTTSFWGGAAMLACAFVVAAFVFPKD